MAVPKVNLRVRKGKKGISYFIDFAVNEKRYRINAGTNKRAATEKQQHTLLELSLGHFNITSVANKIISLEELVKIFLTSKRNHIRPSSLKRYQNYLDKFIDYMNKFFPGPSLSINEIRTNYIDESFNYFLENEITNGKNWETKTVNGLRTILIQLLNYGIKQGYLSTNPARGTNCFPEKPRKFVEFFNDEELDKIWEILEEHWVEPLKFIVHTGLRKGEWIHLLWSNVNLDDNNPSISIVSTREWKTKTGESRVIPLNKNALAIIKKQKGNNPDYVFTSESGAKIHPDKPYRKLKKALTLLGLNGDIHKLRHTFASKLVMNGRPLYDVQKLLGHKDIKTTMIYAHLSTDYLKESVKVLES